MKKNPLALVIAILAFAFSLPALAVPTSTGPVAQKCCDSLGTHCYYCVPHEQPTNRGATLVASINPDETTDRPAGRPTNPTTDPVVCCMGSNGNCYCPAK